MSALPRRSRSQGMQSGFSSLVGDISGYFTTDETEDMLSELAIQIGGASSSTFNFTEANVLADNDAVYAALEKLDLKWGDLFNAASGTEGAFLVGYQSGSGVVATTAGGALDEIADEAKDQGAVAVARLLMANQPTDGDTIGIGADTYEFVNTGVNTVINNDARIGVVIGGSAADTRANLIAAINGAGTAGATVTLADTVTPCLEDGTENLVADEIGTTVRIRSAAAPGGTVVGADPSIVLAESITDAADIWDVGNVNLNTLAGASKLQRSFAQARLTLTAAMIANGVRVDFPFTVTDIMVQIRTSAGGLRLGAATDVFAVANGGVLCTFGGGAAPEAQATDVVTILAWSA